MLMAQATTELDLQLVNDNARHCLHFPISTLSGKLYGFQEAPQ